MQSIRPDLVNLEMLDVEFFDDHTAQTRLVSNLATGQRERSEREIWTRRRNALGGGTYGTVWLEWCMAGSSCGELRAVKEIRKGPTTSSAQYIKELNAIHWFSQERVGHNDNYIQRMCPNRLIVQRLFRLLFRLVPKRKCPLHCNGISSAPRLRTTYW
jgi:hypothetical protein